MDAINLVLNPYSILQVPMTASLEEIRKSWRRLSRELHPDRNTATDAADQFRQVQEAWAILSDENRRARQDTLLQGKVIRDPEKFISTLVKSYLGGFS